MMEFGNTLRLAREAKGYTAAQVAELTKMAPSTVADLENENFSKIAAPIYGRGFVKLYCEAVGIDPKPMVDEFVAIYNGDRDNVIRERKPSEPAAAEPPPAPATPPVSAPPPPPQPQQQPAQSLFDELPEPPASVDTEPPQPADPFAFQDFGATETDQKPAQRTLSRYAAPVRTMHAPSVPPAVWRIAVLGTLALLALWGIALGVRALYRATTSDRAQKTEETARPQEPAPKTAPAPAPAKPEVAPAKPAAAPAKPKVAPAPAPAKPKVAPAPAKPKVAPAKPKAASAKPKVAPAPAKPKAAPAKSKSASAAPRKPQAIPPFYAD